VLHRGSHLQIIASAASGKTEVVAQPSPASGEHSQMLDRVEVAVVEQPLPRLQIVGSGEQTLPFLYDIGWGDAGVILPAPTAPR
jgi:hypothetical protein